MNILFYSFFNPISKRCLKVGLRKVIQCYTVNSEKIIFLPPKHRKDYINQW